MRSRLLSAIAYALIVATTADAQVCPESFTGADYPSVTGNVWTRAQTEARLFDNILGLCSANVEDFGTALADGCLLEADGGALICGSGGGGAPDAHAATHQNGGSDEISVAGLSGVL